jgi:hypothetical protein
MAEKKGANELVGGMLSLALAGVQHYAVFWAANRVFRFASSVNPTCFKTKEISGDWGADE